MSERSFGVNVRNGIIGSLVGGFVLGLMMTMMGMMPMVAMLVGSESVAVGWGVHMVISAIFGVVFGAILSFVAWNRVLVGALWGVAAWVGGALVLMPFFLGMPGMVFDLGTADPWFSLVGHMMYGLIAGGVVWGLERQTVSAPSDPTAST